MNWKIRVVYETDAGLKFGEFFPRRKNEAYRSFRSHTLKVSVVECALYEVKGKGWREVQRYHKEPTKCPVNLSP
jgi:hypothetical protein